MKVEIDSEDVMNMATQKMAAELIAKLSPEQIEAIMTAQIKEAMKSYSTKNVVERVVQDVASQIAKELLSTKEIRNELTLQVRKSIASKIEGIPDKMELGF